MPDLRRESDQHLLLQPVPPVKVRSTTLYAAFQRLRSALFPMTDAGSQPASAEQKPSGTGATHATRDAAIAAGALLTGLGVVRVCKPCINQWYAGSQPETDAEEKAGKRD
jgi:hypothetical protein